MTNLFRVRAIATGVAGSPYYLTTYGLTATGTAQQATDAVRTMLYAGRGCQSSTLNTDMEDSVQTIDSITGQPLGEEGVNGGAGWLGANTGEMLPRQVQLGVSLRTGTFSGGRQIRGHFNLPAIGEQKNTTGGGPNQADSDVIAFQTAINALVASTTFEWVVYSRKLGSQATVQSASISNMWFTLRGRLT
jgi:hypothetical protein